jgi:galactokinase
MLHEFLLSNRDELIRRCRAKVRRRDSRRPTSSELERGLPRFLGQLDEALRHRQAGISMESNRTAALHGKELQEEGYSVDQVVHDYGDICQAITELAREKSAGITVDEFQILNSLLDNAIADAVSSYECTRDSSISAQGDLDLHQRMGALAEEQRRHLDTALKAFAALKLGNIGLMGATGTVLEDSLIRLRDLIEKSLPELRLATGMTKPPKP